MKKKLTILQVLNNLKDTKFLEKFLYIRSYGMSLMILNNKN